MDVFGYPGEQTLRVDMNCRVYLDDNQLDADINTAYDKFWRHEARYAENGCKPPEGRHAMHTSRSFEFGASGSPMFRLENNKPVVKMMYQGGKPDVYYEKGNKDDIKMNEPQLNHRFEYGISMAKVSSLIEDAGSFDLQEELFTSN